MSSVGLSVHVHCPVRAWWAVSRRLRVEYNSKYVDLSIAYKPPKAPAVLQYLHLTFSISITLLSPTRIVDSSSLSLEANFPSESFTMKFTLAAILALAALAAAGGPEICQGGDCQPIQHTTLSKVPHKSHHSHPPWPTATGEHHHHHHPSGTGASSGFFPSGTRPHHRPTGHHTKSEHTKKHHSTGEHHPTPVPDSA